MKKQKIGLALSGGGYRAAAFHLGVFKKLNELNILNKIDIISTVSGGSIIGAYYLLNKESFKDFYSESKSKLRINIQLRLYSVVFLVYILLVFIDTVLITKYFCGLANYWFILIFSIIITLSIGFVFFFKLVPANKILRYIYDKYFYKNKKLNNLPSSPKIVINATNLETGTILSFSQEDINDNSYIYIDNIRKRIEINPASINISFAVTASSAFSPMFLPLKFRKKNYKVKEDYDIFRPLLVDGGVYDNQGIHRIIESKDITKCDIVICSDCALPYKRKYDYLNPVSLLMKTIEVMMKRIRGFQFSHSIYGKCSTAQHIAYFSIGWSFETCIDGFVNAITNCSERRNQLIESHSIPENVINNIDNLKKYIKEIIKYDEIIPNKFKNYNFEKFKYIKTNLKPLDLDTESDLIEYASILCEIQIKLYCQNLFNN